MPTGFPENVPDSLRDNFIRDVYIYDLYDGDTVYYHANLGYNTWAAFQTGRLLDVWAPEIWPLVTREAATKAKDHLWQLIRRSALNRHRPDEYNQLGYHIRLASLPGKNKWFEHIPMPQSGKYGRWLVTLYGCTDEGKVVNLNELMVEHGFATSAPTS